METLPNIAFAATPNELTTILSKAVQIARDNQLKEICSETLLAAILGNEAVGAKLLKMGFNIFLFTRLLVVKLKSKAISSPLLEPQYSVAVDGLLVLTAMDSTCKNTALKLLKTIIKNNNTAAARLLKAERLQLNDYNELIYKPILN